MAIAYIALGSNIGDTDHNLTLALKQMQNSNLTIKSVSEFFITKPYGNVATGDFSNAVCCISTYLKPKELLQTLKTIEQKLGRVPSERWGNRLIDLDIILYDNLHYSDDTLTIPHKDISQRLFVLEPLAQIAGADFILNGKTLSEHIKALKEC